MKPDLKQMEKYQHCHFGRCPRVLCCGQAVLPIGISDVRGQESVKLYCPKCEDIYNSKSSRHERMSDSVATCVNAWLI